MKTHTDSQLIQEYQKGCEEALSELIQRHQTEIFSFIFYKVRDEDLANDIFQDTFIKIIMVFKEDKYNEEGKFIYWAKRIAYNLIVDHFRVRSKNLKQIDYTFDDEGGSLLDHLREPSDNIEDQLVTFQIHKDLSSMLELLPETQKEVIRLRFYDGLSFKEIAEHTNSSINTTLGRVRYAILNLRKIMDEQKLILTR